jgi:septum formation protein
MNRLPGQEACIIENIYLGIPDGGRLSRRLDCYQFYKRISSQNLNEWKKAMIKRLILASQSPRRRDLLNMLGIDNLEIIPADIKEEVSSGLPVGEAAAQVALLKAVSIGKKVGERDLILAADTLVALDNHILGKPADDADAARMLSMLSGRTHNVCTGVALIQNGRRLCRYETTYVTFRELTEKEIYAYIASGEPLERGRIRSTGARLPFHQAYRGRLFQCCRITALLTRLDAERNGLFPALTIFKDQL